MTPISPFLFDIPTVAWSSKMMAVGGENTSWRPSTCVQRVCYFQLCNRACTSADGCRRVFLRVSSTRFGWVVDTPAAEYDASARLSALALTTKDEVRRQHHAQVAESVFAPPGFIQSFSSSASQDHVTRCCKAPCILNASCG